MGTVAKTLPQKVHRQPQPASPPPASSLQAAQPTARPCQLHTQPGSHPVDGRASTVASPFPSSELGNF
ncbi:hypothetical protein DSO57_1005397 [Entomophthora muscae]|uniref:Uncharacterized protein n=1 Tax=Entomophthora muscae TaxID=34485 RepID=A0ACC2RYV3_9FUNG|nr:hypothetical protein DSO57_1005397 [Entomophthora muscae]